MDGKDGSLLFAVALAGIPTPEEPHLSSDGWEIEQLSLYRFTLPRRKGKVKKIQTLQIKRLEKKFEENLKKVLKAELAALIGWKEGGALSSAISERVERTHRRLNFLINSDCSTPEEVKLLKNYAKFFQEKVNSILNEKP